MTLTPEERARFCNDVATRHPDDYESIIAAEIRAAIADATRWIPVSERLPENAENVNVLLSDVNQLRLAGQYAPGGWGVWGFSQDNLDSMDAIVVAWQPMPPPLAFDNDTEGDVWNAFVHTQRYTPPPTKEQP